LRAENADLDPSPVRLSTALCSARDAHETDALLSFSSGLMAR
jgi:hypothetical protein